MKRNQRAAIFFAVLLFACGVAAGILAQRYFITTVVNAKSAEDFRHQYISEMRDNLHLTPAQTNQLEVILDQTKAKYKALRDSYHPQMLQIKGEQEERVKSILTPAQVPAYEHLVAERERRYRDQEEHEHKEELKREADHRAHAGQ
ncbi:MAG TPA: hypothetical protein VHZ55_16305 [Bryobacteraceae bacterium]|jgi:hypothetical protein|nr:hypothetical protein [Bryobacteraceae bacterium]